MDGLTENVRDALYQALRLNKESDHAPCLVEALCESLAEIDETLKQINATLTRIAEQHRKEL